MQEHLDRIQKAGVQHHRQREKNQCRLLIPHQLNQIARVRQAIIANILQCRHVSKPLILNVGI